MDKAKIDITKVEEKNIFRPIHHGEVPKMTPIPNAKEGEVDIDLFLNSLNLPKSWRNEDCMLYLHPLHREKLIELAKTAGGYTGMFTRYRNFLLLFDEDLPEGLFYVASIFDVVQNLERLDSDPHYKMSLKEKHHLDYIKANRFKVG